MSFVWVDKIKDNDLLNFYKSLLLQTEIKNYNRFCFLRHRKQYLVTRALIRTNIANYLGIDPKDVNFIQNKYGRPEISPEKNLMDLRFNLSHTDGLIMCGVILNNDFGVDVEYTNINFSDKIIDDANDWLLWLLDISEQYIAAVSLKISKVT